MARETVKIKKLHEKMATIDQEFTELDVNELTILKQSVLACQQQINRFHEQQPTELFATPRPQVLPSDLAQPRTLPSREPSRRRHPSRRLVRGRSRRDKRRHPDQGDRESATRQRFDPVTVQPAVTIPRPTVASLFVGGADDLSSSCPTSQEPSQAMTVPQVFQELHCNSADVCIPHIHIHIDQFQDNQILRGSKVA